MRINLLACADVGMYSSKILKTKPKSGSNPEDIGPTLEFIFKKYKINKRVRHGFAISDTYSFKEIAQALSNSGAWIVTLPSGSKYHTMIVTKIVGNEVFILDPWPINGLAGIGKSKEGVEAVMDFDKFIELWHSANFAHAQALN